MWRLSVAEWRKRKRKRLEAALFREVEAEAEAVMKKLMEAVKKKINGSGSDTKLPLPDTASS